MYLFNTATSLWCGEDVDNTIEDNNSTIFSRNPYVLVLPV